MDNHTCGMSTLDLFNFTLKETENKRDTIVHSFTKLQNERD